MRSAQIIVFNSRYKLSFTAYSVSPRLDSSLKKTRPVEVSIQFYNYGPGAGAATKTLAADSLRIITPSRFLEKARKSDTGGT